jgi:hypothetical protein
MITTRAAFKEFVKLALPINLRLADGRHIRVPSGDYLALAPDEDRILVWRTNGSFELLPLDKIDSMAADTDFEVDELLLLKACSCEVPEDFPE